MPRFNVHLLDSPAIQVEAPTPDLARKEALRQQPGALILKVKRCKENA